MKKLFFNGIRNLMLTDRECRKQGIAVKVIPLPPAEATECGMSLVIANEDLSAVLEILKSLMLDVKILDIEK